MDLGLGFVCASLLVIKLEILVLSWAIFSAPAHLISILSWERSMVLD
jgi:hypothetical protein